MKTSWLSRLVVLAAALCFPFSAGAQDRHQNHFASIMLDGKKIGHVHYSITHDEEGELEELKTKASVSVFGLKLYDFTQHLHEKWSKGELQSVWGNTNDNGTIEEITLTRRPNEYEGSLNGEALTLPHEAFPISLWHYGVSQQTLLFDLSDLRLMEVNVSERVESLPLEAGSVQAERFDFTGDWEGTVWFDQEKQFVKAEYLSEGRLITVIMDP